MMLFLHFCQKGVDRRGDVFRLLQKTLQSSLFVADVGENLLLHVLDVAGAGVVDFLVFVVVGEGFGGRVDLLEVGGAGHVRAH